jgi:hypothetical protein
MKLKPWVSDVVEQICIAEILNDAPMNSSERLALIVCDNAVEFMMIAFVEVEKHLVGHGIKRKDWDEAKQVFERLLDFACSHNRELAQVRGDVLSFHKLRNTLYHTGLPVSVKREHVADYLTHAKTLVSSFFAVAIGSSEWDTRKLHAATALCGRASTPVQAHVTAELVGDSVRVCVPPSLGNLETLCLVLHLLTKTVGGIPTIEQLERSLALSGFSHLSGANLSKRIYDARRKGLIQKDSLALSQSGRQAISMLLPSV